MYGNCFSSKNHPRSFRVSDLNVKDENIFLLFNVKRNLNVPNLENVD